MLLVGLGFPMVGVIKHEVGRHEIVVSVVAETEVVKLEGVASDEAEKAILEFFGRDYVLRANLDVPVAERTRKLVRAYGLKPQDALHVAGHVVVLLSDDVRVENA